MDFLTFVGHTVKWFNEQAAEHAQVPGQPCHLITNSTKIFEVGHQKISDILYLILLFDKQLNQKVGYQQILHLCQHQFRFGPLA